MRSRSMLQPGRSVVPWAAVVLAVLPVLGGCEKSEPEVTIGPPPDWIRTARPEQLYMLQCAQCHGSIELVNGRVTVGISHRRVLVVGPWLRVAPQPGESEAEAMSRIILDGIPDTEMIGFRRGLSDAKALELANWILELRALAAQNIEDGPRPSPDGEFEPNGGLDDPDSSIPSPTEPS